MMNEASTHKFIVTNGIGAKYSPQSDAVWLALPGRDPLTLLVERGEAGVGEILIESGQMARISNALGGRSQQEIEAALSVTARGTYARVIFSLE